MTAAPAIEIATDEQDRRVPRLGGSEVAVAEIVYACHELTIDQGLARVAISGLDRDDARARPHLLRRGALHRGRRELPRLPAPHGGRGGRRARSVHRPPSRDRRRRRGRPPHRHGRGHASRRQPRGARQNLVGGKLLVLGAPGHAQAAPRHPPRAHTRRGLRRRGRDPGHPAHGAPARRQRRHGGAGLANFGLDALRLVAPRDGWPNEKARIAASGANYVIDDAVAFPTLSDAIGDLNWLAATTARQRDLRKPVMTPVEAAAEMRTRICAGGALRGAVRAGAQWAGDERGRQRRRARHDPGQFSFRFAQSGAGGAAPGL